MTAEPESWPPLHLAGWAETCATLHMWPQVVGKSRLATAPPVNHWWHVVLYVTARGLTTSPMPYRGGTFQIAFDFVDHQSIRFDRDTQHGAYDARAAHQFWLAPAEADRVLKIFRGRFIGKCSPVHVEAYSQEVSSAGFWPGAAPAMDAAFYAYAMPEPPGYKTARAGPSAAVYDTTLNEFILKYDDVRSLASRHDAPLEFLQTTYEAGADLAHWNRAELEAPAVRKGR